MRVWHIVCGDGEYGAGWAEISVRVDLLGGCEGQGGDV